MAAIAAQLDLDVCTPEGKTWLAQLTGLGGKYGVIRNFLNGRPDLSRSGRTGTYTYTLTEPGVYESNEGRRRLGRKWWRVTDDGDVVEITEQEALAYLKEQAS